MSTLITPILHAEDPGDGAPDILEALSFAGGMARMVSSALSSLITRHPDLVEVQVVHTGVGEVTIVVSSHTGDGRDDAEVELQVVLIEDVGGYGRTYFSVAFFTNPENKDRTLKSQVSPDLAGHIIRKVSERQGEREACSKGVVDVDYDAFDRPYPDLSNTLGCDLGLFLALGVHVLGDMVELAVWEDITVVDNDEPMVIGAANAQGH